MWIGIIFIILGLDYAPYGMGYTTHDSEDECYFHYAIRFDVEDEINDQPPVNFYNSKYKIKSYWKQDLGKIFVSCMHKDELPINK